MTSRGPTTQSLDERIDGLADDLAGFRLEAEKRSGAIETALSDIRGDLKEFRTGIRTDLRWIKLIGGSIVTLLLGAGAFSGRVIWDAASIASDVRQQGQRIDKLEGRMDRVEKRLDGIDQKLDTLLNRTAPKESG